MIFAKLQYSNLKYPFRITSKSYFITPSAEKSVINLNYDLSDIILDGYNVSDLIVPTINYTDAHRYQQVTITDANGGITGTANIMAETMIPFSLRFAIVLYKTSAFN